MDSGNDYYPWTDWVKIPENAKLAKEDYSEAMKKYNRDRYVRMQKQEYFRTNGILRMF